MHREDGQVNFLHSSKPTVREEPLDAYIAKSLEKQKANPKKARLFGFKFLRIQENPLDKLRDVDGPQPLADPDDVWKAYTLAIDDVTERLVRITNSFNQAGVTYA